MAKEKTERKPIDREALIELIVAIMLGVVALTSAWGGWIGSLHGGNQASNYTEANTLASEGNAMYNEGAQTLMQDMILWNDLSDLRIDYTYAEEAGDVEAMDRLGWKIDQMIADNCTEEFQDAIVWSDEQEYASSPFDMPGYVDTYFEAANEVLAESDAKKAEGDRDNQCGDAFGLVGVIYTVVLFLLGIVGTFKRLPNRQLVLAISIVAFIATTIYMFTIPMPTGFDLFSYFGIK